MRTRLPMRFFCVQPMRWAMVLLLFACGITPRGFAASFRQHYEEGVYRTRDGRLLHALVERTPGTYWIDGYRMVISNQTQICWHDSILQFGPILNRNGQPVPRIKATAPCEIVPWDTLGQGAWLQYMAIQKYGRDIFKPSMKVAATRIDVWKNGPNGNLPSSQSAGLQPAWKTLCASASPHELHYPNEGPVDVVCDAKVNIYVENVFSSLLKPSTVTPDAPIEKQEIPRFYVVKPFQVRHNYDFEAIDGSSGYYDLSFLSWYMNPRAHSAVQKIVYAPDGTVLIPDTALAHLRNEAQFSALLSYSLATEDQDLIGHLFQVQRFKVNRLSRKKSGGNNLLYTADFIFNLNNHVLLIGIRQMYLAGFDIRYAPYAWAVEQGKRIKGPVDEPGKHMPWYATYGFNDISQLYPDVDYGKLKKGEAEYQQFLGELRKADPEAFEKK